MWSRRAPSNSRRFEADDVSAPGLVGEETGAHVESEAWADIQRLLRGGSLNLIGGLLSAGLAFGFTLLITRQLGPAGAGVFFQAIGIFAIAMVACQLGASSMVVKTVSAYHALGRSRDITRVLGVATLPVAAVSVLAGVAAFAIAPALSDILVRHGDRHDALVYLRVLSLFLPLAVLYTIVLAATQGLGSMLPTVALDNTAIPGLRFGFAAFGMYVALPPVATAGLWAAPYAIALVLSIVTLRRLLRAPSSRGARVGGRSTAFRRLFSDFWSLTVPQWATDVFQLAVLWIDVVLLGMLASSRDAGIYAAMSRLATVGAIASVALSVVLGPMLGGLLARNELQRVRRLYHTATIWLTVTSMPVFLIIVAFAPLLAGIFGADFSTGSTALRIISLAMLLWGLTGIALMTLRMGGRTKLIMADAAAAFIVNIALNAVLIPLMAMNGAAIAWAASILLINLLAIVQTRRLWGIQPFDRRFFAIAAGAVLCFGVGGVVSASIAGQSASTLVVSTIIEMLVFSGILWHRRDTLTPAPFLEAMPHRVKASSEL